MPNHKSVAVDLALLTEALDSSSSDIAASLVGLVSAVADAVPSLVGLTVQVGQPDTRVEVTTIEDRAQVARIRTSLSLPLQGQEPPGHFEGLSGVLVVYGETPGSLVDLAADLTWLTGRPLSEARLDEDLGGPRAVGGGAVSRPSTINQALGVLIGDGLTAEQAVVELDTRAVTTGIGRHRVAAEILASLPARRNDSRAEET